MALAMIEGAERRGVLRAGRRVVEFTGGSTGSSLAFICAVKGYSLTLVSSDAFSPEKLRYVIDQDWYGELPRSYYYDADHQRSSHSGTLSQQQLSAWLGKKG